jgi:hypothetical protein
MFGLADHLLRHLPPQGLVRDFDPVHGAVPIVRRVSNVRPTGSVASRPDIGPGAPVRSFAVVFHFVQRLITVAMNLSPSDMEPPAVHEPRRE